MGRAADDAALVSAALAGDRGAFAKLVARHGARARAAAAGTNPHEAEDVVQDAILAAFLGLRRLRNPERFGSWLAAIAANLARMRLRGRRPAVPLGESTPSQHEASPEEALAASEVVRAVRRALGALPEGQRQVALLYYVEGRSCREVAAVLGRSPGAVRVALHRARGQLQERLAPSLARESTIRKEEYPMVEVTLEDVVVRMLPVADEAPKLANERLRIVLLREKDGTRVLPIWVGSAEGDALALQIGGDSFERPLTSDLMVRLLEAVGARVERVTITSLRETTFYALVSIASGGEAHDVDARPSDALNLAARVGAPIFVEEQVLAEAGIAADDVFAGLTAESAKYHGGEVPEGEWRSLSVELVKELHRPPRA